MRARANSEGSRRCFWAWRAKRTAFSSHTAAGGDERVGRQPGRGVDCAGDDRGDRVAMAVDRYDGALGCRPKRDSDRLVGIIGIVTAVAAE